MSHENSDEDIASFFIYTNELLNYPISYKKLLSNIQSIDSLRKLNSKLLAEIAELRKVNAKLKDKNAEIPDLKRKFAEIESEKVELKARIAKLLRQAVKKSKRRNVENAELKARIEKLEKSKTVTTKLESENADSPNFNSVADQLSMATYHEKPLVDKKIDISLPEELILEVIAKQSVSAVNISIMDQCDQTILEDKETNAFLDEMHKKKISDEIKQCNREKKLQAQEDGGEVPPEEKIGSKQDSKCKKGRSVNKLKQELFALELVSYKKMLLIEQNYMTKISETLCSRKVTSDKSSIDEASQHLHNGIIESSGGKFSEKKARDLLYNSIAKQLNLLHKQKSQEMDATSISKLTNKQIQKVIDYRISLEKLPLVTDHMTEISETLCPRKNLPKNIPPKTKNDQISVPISSTHNSNSSIKKFSSENFDYYGITDETSCPLYKLDHNDEEGIDNYNFAFAQPWNSPCPICVGKYENYRLYGEWYRNGTEYCLTCNTSSNKFKFAIVA
ncbi:hypothetical protein C1646_773545 [Rhizophagus diaphanus]|nr:hypothetical protein C1646_773545 [Rhizophagus diaphanus] [Rhizophagus sp. MUCL 43196]